MTAPTARPARAEPAATGLLAPFDGRSPAGLFSDADYAAVRAFFEARPELAPTPLHRLQGLAHRLGIGELLVKDETARFGLNAFKAAGATFAIATLRARGDITADSTVVCASEGNHGRAVARAAREAGCRCRVYMADSVAPARQDAIRGEHAEVVLVAGSYDDAVRQMAAEARSHGWTVVSDTSWDGYEEIPRLIMLGYTRLMDEAEASWSPGPAPDVIFVPAGVGGLLAAVASWAAWRYPSHRPRIVAVEPLAAACVQASLRAGRPATLNGPFATAMGGLRCGEISPMTFATLQSLVDASISIDDAYAFEAMRLLARPSPPDPVVRSGASGAAALGGLIATLRAPSLSDVREGLGLTAAARALVLVSEGVTEPDLFDRVVAHA